MLYVVASMEEELYGLRDELEALEPSGGVGFPVEFHTVGVGPKRAGGALTSALAKGKRRPQGVLMLGVAGALEPGMETGELLLAANYALDAGSEPAKAIVPDPAMLEAAEAAAANARMPANGSSSLTVDHLIDQAQEREELRRKYGAASANMEDHAVAAAAAAAGVPFLSVRVILDTVEQCLPAYLPGLSRGRHAILTDIIMRPWRIPTVLRLKSQMELCQSVIRGFGMSYLRLEAERRKNAKEKESTEAIY